MSSIRVIGGILNRGNMVEGVCAVTAYSGVAFEAQDISGGRLDASRSGLAASYTRTQSGCQARRQK